ncbi:acetyl-coenzyme A synthetase, partial [Desmospora sp. 8437]
MAMDVDRHAETGRVAIRWENDRGEKRDVSYLELKEESDRVARGLLASGLQKGDRIMILLPRMPEAYVAYLGALKAGLAVLPGSEMLQPSDISYRIRHAQAQAVIFDSPLRERVETARENCTSLRYGWVHGENVEGWESFSRLGAGVTDVELPKTRSDDVAFISYTSGTTGGPKGVIHHHSWAVAHQAVAARQWLGVRPGDTVWATAGPGWAKWVWSPFISTLGSGATGLVYQGRFDASRYLSLIEEYQVNVLCCTPTEYRMMAKADDLERYRLSSLRSAVSAGEPLNREVIETFRRYFNIQVRDGYGQTENTLLAATLE